MEVERIVKLRPLYASRHGVLGGTLRPWVWFLPGFTTNGPTLRTVDRANVPMEGGVFFFLSSSFVLFFLCFTVSREKREERVSGAPGFQWPKCDDVGGILCSRSTRTRGGRWLVERKRGMAETAAAKA
uniref:Uncharacterized protein n=1 Tax=Oryza nivara TaxID=4536 RepID=A0A0E0GXJ9_ORYNI